MTAGMSRSAKILILASTGLRAALVEQLALHSEFELVEAAAADLGMRLIAETTPDLLLLDADCGAELVETARSGGFSGPILMLGGEAPAGATERIVRPFRFADLLARIRDSLRPREDDPSDVPLGAYRFRPGSGELLHETGSRLRLTEKETAILSRLARARGDTVPRDMLLREVWGYNPAVTTRTLETHIYRLRRKIEPDPSNARLLVTETKGYRLVVGDDV